MKANASKRLREWRERHGWSWSELGELTGYGRISVYYFERGFDDKGYEFSEKVLRRYIMACIGVGVIQKLDDADTRNLTRLI